MKSTNEAAAALLLGCTAAIAFGTTAVADPAAGAAGAEAQPGTDSAKQPAKVQPGKDLVEQEAKPTESKKAHKPLSYYQFNTPQRVWEYDRDNDTCKMPKMALPGPVNASATEVTPSLPSKSPPSEEHPLRAPRGTRFIVVRTIGDQSDPQFVIRICKDDWRGKLIGSCGWDPDKPRPQGQEHNDRYIDNEHSQFDKYYCISKSDFDTMHTEGYIDEKLIRAQLEPAYGLNFTLPIKIRRAIPGFNTTLDKDIQIGGFFGAKWRISDTNDYYIDLPVVSAGLTTLTIAKGTAPSAMDGSRETMGIAASAGFIIELSEFQLGIMTGIDRAPGEVGKGWRYNGKLWYSFSIGYSFLKSK